MLVFAYRVDNFVLGLRLRMSKAFKFLVNVSFHKELFQLFLRKRGVSGRSFDVVSTRENLFLCVDHKVFHPHFKEKHATGSFPLAGEIKGVQLSLKTCFRTVFTFIVRKFPL